VQRAVVLTTLVILLLAVAGVSVAQEGGIFAGGSNGDDPLGSTTPEGTSFEATVVEDPEASAPPGTEDAPGDGEDASEPTVLTEPTVEETEEPTVDTPVVEETRAPALNNVGNPGSSSRGIRMPEHAGAATNIGEPHPNVGHPGNGKPLMERGNEAGRGRGVGHQKVALCHKEKPLTVGAPALVGHLRQGDGRGACRPDGAGPTPSGGTVGPQAAKNGVSGASGGRVRVALCHKGENTLTVGASARAAHLRHGDSIGACR
jgi:hypothetical protein